MRKFVSLAIFFYIAYFHLAFSHIALNFNSHLLLMDLFPFSVFSNCAHFHLAPSPNAPIELRIAQ
jgi:hypothetical protein